MTREEAIKILRGARITSFRPNGTAIVKEALDMAIEALSEEYVTIQEVELKKPFTIDEPTEDWKPRIVGNVEVVVRCKDCKSSRVYGKTTQWLACEDVMEGQATDPDGYCYLGERRE